MNPFTIGLTGGIASGKSVCAAYFAEKNIPIIDADLIVRNILSNHYDIIQKICDYFGKEILDVNGVINRKKLRSIIFQDTEKKRWLEELIHPCVKNTVEKELKIVTAPYVIFVSPLLIETKQHQWVDRVLVIDTIEDLQMYRTQQRDQCSFSEVKRIMASQIKRDERKQYADDIVENNASLAHLHQQLEKLHEFYVAESIKKSCVKE